MPSVPLSNFKARRTKVEHLEVVKDQGYKNGCYYENERASYVVIKAKNKKEEEKSGGESSVSKPSSPSRSRQASENGQIFRYVLLFMH